MWGNIIKKGLMSFAFEKTPHISLTCELVPVQYREYEYGLITATITPWIVPHKVQILINRIYDKFRS